MSYVIRFHVCRSVVWLLDIFACLLSEKTVPCGQNVFLGGKGKGDNLTKQNLRRKPPENF